MSKNNTNIVSTHNQILADLKINEAPQQAIHIEWESLADSFSKLLSGFLHRRIIAQPDREEYYYWLIHLFDTPLTQAELETLF